MWLMIASSISSPPTRSDCETTIPPSEITATSVVPPPMSTIMFPVGSATGRPAPIAAAIGSPIRYALRAAGRCGPRLRDETRRACTGGARRLLDGPLLDAGHAGRHAHDDARMRKAVLV